MLEHIGELHGMLGPLGDSLSPEERRLVGLDPDPHPAEYLRTGAERTLQEDAIATSQQHVPLGTARAVDRKDMRPWQGKESDAELMFNFEAPQDAQDLYDFIIESGLCLPGEVRLHLGDHQSSVHFASSVLVQKPDVIQMALIAYEDQLADTEEDEAAFESLAEDVEAVLVERAALAKRGGAGKLAKRTPSKRGSAEPSKTGRGVDFNPFHDKQGVFTSREGLGDGGSWSDGKQVRLKATKKGAKLHFAGTKRPCGREARGKGKDIRCWDGKPGLGLQLSKTLGDKKRESKTPMPHRKPAGEAWDARNLPAVQEALALYGIDQGDRQRRTMAHLLTTADVVLDAVAAEGVPVRGASGDGMGDLLGGIEEGFGRSSRRGRDPYWMIAKYAGKDAHGTPFKKGEKVFYYPNDRTMLAGAAGEQAAREFKAAADDERFMTGMP